LSWRSRSRFRSSGIGAREDAYLFLATGRGFLYSYLGRRSSCGPTRTIIVRKAQFDRIRAAGEIR
jgi:hypothetical protein